MPFIARYGFLLLVLVFCGCFHLSIALLVVAFCWYEKPKRATKGKKCPNGNQALQRLQDRAARIVDKNNGTENPLFKLGWLDVQQQIDFDTSVMVRKTLNKTAPSYFTEMFQEVIGPQS